MHCRDSPANMAMAEILLKIACWGCLGALLYSYGLYPLLLRILAKGKAFCHTRYEEGETASLPRLSILISAYNEEKVLRQKLDSIAAAQYPKELLKVYLGSDASTDATDALAAEYAGGCPWLRFRRFGQRGGKPGVINALAAEALETYGSGPEHILLITDANVLFMEDTLFKLLRHFKEPGIAVVDSVILPQGQQAAGISRAEGRYLGGEARLKYCEGLLWGAMIGPFGAGYAVRASHFEAVPPNFLVDDFYIAMRAVERGGKAISDPEARVLEGATHRIEVEFRRKKRIGAGNFQNMALFRRLWWPPVHAVGFAFFSHKILRWTGPHSLWIALLCTLFLALLGNQWYGLLFLMQSALLAGVPLLDLMLARMGIQVLLLRGMRYFLLMNAALFAGWIFYKKGIKTNVWQPTERAT